MIVVAVNKTNGTVRYISDPSLKGLQEDIYFFRNETANIFSADLSGGSSSGPISPNENGSYPVLEWDNSPEMRTTIYNYWVSLRDKDTSTLIKANALWWATPGANWRQNIFAAGQYSRDAILQENPLSKDLIALNSVVITYNSQDTSLCEDNFMDSELGLIDIIGVPYVVFYMPKEVSEKLFSKKNKIPDYLVLSIDEEVVFNDAMIKRLQYGPAIEQEYFIPAGTDKHLPKFDKKKEVTQEDYEYYAGFFDDQNIWGMNSFSKEHALFKKLQKSLDAGWIMSSRDPCDPTDNLYQRLLEYIQED